MIIQIEGDEPRSDREWRTRIGGLQQALDDFQDPRSARLISMWGLTAEKVQAALAEARSRFREGGAVPEGSSLADF